MHALMREEGFPYAFDPSACASCQGRCCTGESGYIYVTKTEALAICSVLNIELSEFVAQYVFKNGNKYSLKERVFGEQHECIFFDRENNGCQIYTARPTQCRTFPFWDYFKANVDELKAECPGIIDD